MYFIVSLDRGRQGVDRRDVVLRPNVACLSSRSLPPTTPLPTLHLPFTRSLFSHPPIEQSVPSSLALSVSLSLYVYLVPGSICLVYSPYVSPTNCQNHPSNGAQTLLPNVCATRSLAICISFVPRHGIFRECVLSAGFRSPCRRCRGRCQPCLRSKPSISIFVASVSRVFDTLLIFDDNILISNTNVCSILSSFVLCAVI